MKKIILLSVLVSVFLNSYSQQLCTIHGTITDKNTAETIPFTRVLLLDGDVTKGYANSDFDGNYVIQNIAEGSYTLVVKNPDYKEKTIKDVHLVAGKITILNIVLEVEKKRELELVEITVSNQQPVRKRLINKDEGKSSSIQVRGARTDSYYVDGIKTTTESYSKINDNSFQEVSKNPLSTFSIDVDKASYSNVRRFINSGSLPPADAVRVEEMINYFKYEYPQPVGKDPFSITTEYTECPWNKNHQLIHIGLQGKEIVLDKSLPNNLVFLIDVSGSMQSADKLELLKSGLYMLIDQLRDEDKVAIVVYAGAAGLVLPSTSGDKKEKIKSIVEGLTASGSTAGGEGINLAYKIAKENFKKNGNNRVILATDGDFNVGVSDESGLIKLIEEKRNDDIFLSVLGFGTGNLQDSKMEQIADKGNGMYFYIDNLLEAKKVLVKEMGGTLITIAKDVKIQTEFNPKFVKGYRLVGYENRILADEDFNDDQKDAGEIGAGHTVTAIYEIIPAHSKEKISKTDPLKYQMGYTKSTNSDLENEVMTIKFRYKNPKDTVSNLITHVISSPSKPLTEASENLKFSVAVAEFGMLLRNSEFKGDSTYKGILELAKNAKGKDEDGYRAEFIRLVEMAELLKNN